VEGRGVGGWAGGRVGARDGSPSPTAAPLSCLPPLPCLPGLARLPSDACATKACGVNATCAMFVAGVGACVCPAGYAGEPDVSCSPSEPQPPAGAVRAEEAWVEWGLQGHGGTVILTCN
jgi:hypothetical protein